MKKIHFACFAAAIALLGCGGDKTQTSDVPSTVVTSMEAFLADVSSEARRQVVFIGLDGAAWDIIDPMIEAGELPTFARLKREGASGILKSVPCYFSPPAWTSMFTGYSPENTGIYTFGKWDSETKRFSSVSSADVAVPSLWDVASAAGRRVAVINVPMTYPARPVNGVMVTGLMTPFVYEREEKALGLRLRPLGEPFHEELDGRSKSPPMIAIAPNANNTFTVVLYDTSDDQEANYDTAALRVVPRGTDWRKADVPVYVAPLNTYSEWVRFDYQRPTGGGEMKTVQASFKVEQKPGGGRRGREDFAMLILSPLFRVPSDPDLDMTHPETFAAEIEDALGAYIINLNFAPDLITQKVKDTARFASFFYNYDDWDFFVYNFMATDNIQHREGYSPRARQIYTEIDGFLAALIDELPQDVVLVVASDHGFSHYDYVIDLNKFLNELGLLRNIDDPDYSTTLAFHNQWCIYFNDALLTEDELERRGIPPKGKTPRDALIAYLQQKAQGIQDDSGRTYPIELVEVPEDAAGVPPDMIVIGAYADYYVEGPDLVSKRDDTVTPTRSDAVAYHDRGWFHDRDGIYVLWGSDVQSGVDGGVRRIEDMTPTILFLLGLPLAENFDGHVMADLLRPDALAGRQVVYLENYGALAPSGESADAELQSLEEKLRSLGYIR